MIAPPIRPPTCAPIDTFEMRNLSSTRLISSSGPNCVSQKRTPRCSITTVAQAPTPNTAPDAPPPRPTAARCRHSADAARPQRVQWRPVSRSRWWKQVSGLCGGDGGSGIIEEATVLLGQVLQDVGRDLAEPVRVAEEILLRGWPPRRR